MSLFPNIMQHHCRFFRRVRCFFRMVCVCVFFFYLVTTSWLLTSAYHLRFETINDSINVFPPTGEDINARGGSMSSSYVVKYT